MLIILGVETPNALRTTTYVPDNAESENKETQHGQATTTAARNLQTAQIVSIFLNYFDNAAAVYLQKVDRTF